MDSVRDDPARSLRSRPAILAGLLVALGTLVLIAFGTPVVTGLVIASLAILAYFAGGRAFEKSLVLTVVIAFLLPNEMFRKVIKPQELMPLVAVLFLFVSSRNRAGQPVGLRLTATELWVLLLIAAAFLGAVNGLAAGFPAEQVLDEFALLLGFALAIVVVRGNPSESGIRQVIYGLIVAAVLVSLRYLSMFIASAGKDRAASDQQVLLLLAVPIAFAFLLLERGTIRRTVWLVPLLIMAPAVYVTQTRALWLYVPLSVMLLAVLYVRHRHLKPRSLLSLGIAVVIAVLAVGGYVTLTSGARAGHRALASRAETMKELGRDLSLASRVDFAFQAFNRVSRSPIWGAGLGDHLRYRIIPTPARYYFLDFSYMWVLWKLGILGLVPMIGLYFVFLRNVWLVYRRTSDFFQLRVAAGVFVGFVVMLVIGFESGVLVIYRFNLVWAILMGIFEIWARPLEPGSRTHAAL